MFFDIVFIDGQHPDIGAPKGLNMTLLRPYHFYVAIVAIAAEASAVLFNVEERGTELIMALMFALSSFLICDLVCRFLIIKAKQEEER